jgi:multiple sugar transport system ATP-binding protein
MRDGVLQQLGTPREVYEHPANIFVAGFIGTPAMNFAPLTQGGRSLLLWGRTPVALAPKERKAVREHDGDVVLGVRPEHITVRSGRSRTDAGSFRAVVEVVEAAGDRTYLVLRAEDETLTARVDPDFVAETGDPVRVSFGPRNVHLFDASTEKAIAHAGTGRS